MFVLSCFQPPLSNISYVTQLQHKPPNGFTSPLCFLTHSEPAASSLLSDFQPVLPFGPLSLQTGAAAAASLPQAAPLCCAALPALPSRRRPLNAHR